jgi:ABC-type uncharacterized transport system substrate-binding protein
MRRRDFIKALGAGAALWPLAARAQRLATPVIGYLAAGNPKSEARLVDAFVKGLGEAGYQDGKNAKIEYRWAENQYDRLPAMAADLVGREVAVIAATTTPAVRAAKAATGRIPIVFAQAKQLGALTVRNKMPAIYTLSEFAASGGLISYGASRADAWHKAGVYVGRILKGEKPAELPVIQPTTFEFAINLRTAKALGVSIPLTLIASADEIIE